MRLMNCVRALLLLAGLAAIGCAPAEGDETLESGLEICAALDSPDERLACFDALSRSAEKEQEPAGGRSPRAEPAEGPAAPEAGTAPRPLTDDVAKPASGNDGKAAEEVYTATLIRCEERGPSGRTYFLLENGQVWRQSNSNKLRLSDCSGEVRISTDFFGYKLYIPDEELTVRVRRVR